MQVKDIILKNEVVSLLPLDFKHKKALLEVTKEGHLTSLCYATIPNNKEFKEGLIITFDEVANVYDDNEQFLISAKKLMSFIDSSYFTKDTNILDLSCGTGAISLTLSKHFPKTKIDAIDISKNMLEVARKKAMANNISNITFTLQDVETLSFKNKKFDLITCGYSLFFYPNLEYTYKNICKNINKNGQFIFSTFMKNAFEPYIEIFKTILEKNYNISYPKELDSNALDKKEDILKLVKSSNPKNIRIEKIDINYKVSFEKWWNILNSTGYKGLIMQLNQYDLIKFKNEYFNNLEKLSVNKTLKINANSYFTILYF